MSHVASVPHECGGNFIFTDNNLGPYWAISKLLISRFDGFSGDIKTEIDGELWTLTLTYQRSGIASRACDTVGSDRLYEFRIGARGTGERKANFLISPRFVDMRHYETGEGISTPFDHIPEEEGVNVRFTGSNLEPEEYIALLPQFVGALAAAAESFVNPAYFAGKVHEMSNITTYERYVRLNRNWSQKLVGQAGVMQRLFHLCATERGSKVEYRIDNKNIVGYNHRLILPTEDAQRLINGHRFGKQLKHYHPEHTRKKDDTDPLYHPKVGVLVKKSLSGHSFDWVERKQLRREIDETLINLLHWSAIPIKADRTTYVPDKHFVVRSSEEPIALVGDPTPVMEINQQALLVTMFQDLCESDIEVLETLVHDGGQQHPTELATKTERGISTIYRALERLKGIVRNDRASVSFTSMKFQQEIAAIMECTEYQLENRADRVAKILNLEARQAASSAWQQWCYTYAGRIVEVSEDGEHTLRIDTILSRLKSSSNPCVRDVLQQAVDAWMKDGRDAMDLLRANIEWRTSPDSWEVGWVEPTLR